MSRAYRFIGREDEFLQGVPQGDLSSDQYEALTAEQKDILERNVSGPAPLYKAAGGKDGSGAARNAGGRPRAAQGPGEAQES
jgi:hypothetical protein